MFATKFPWLIFLLASVYLAGCSATPVPIPGTVDTGPVGVADAGASDSSSGSDGLILPDLNLPPYGDAGPDAVAVIDAEAGAPDAEAGASDAEAGVGDADIMVEGGTGDADLGEDDAEPDSVLEEGGV